jgi:hypothetical protein
MIKERARRARAQRVGKGEKNGGKRREKGREGSRVCRRERIDRK